MARRPTLVVNPAADGVFVEFAETVVEHGVASPAELERRLRVVYPQAAVHRRELVAEPWDVWYVYRDGHWVRSAERARSGTRQHDAQPS